MKKNERGSDLPVLAITIVALVAVAIIVAATIGIEKRPDAPTFVGYTQTLED